MGFSNGDKVLIVGPSNIGASPNRVVGVVDHRSPSTGHYWVTSEINNFGLYYPKSSLQKVEKETVIAELNTVKEIVEVEETVVKRTEVDVEVITLTLTSRQAKELRMLLAHTNYENTDLQDVSCAIDDLSSEYNYFDRLDDKARGHVDFYE